MCRRPTSRKTEERGEESQEAIRLYRQQMTESLLRGSPPPLPNRRGGKWRPTPPPPLHLTVAVSASLCICVGSNALHSSTFQKGEKEEENASVRSECTSKGEGEREKRDEEEE